MSQQIAFTGFTSHRGLQITNSTITGQTSRGHGAKRWLRYGKNSTSHNAISFDSFPSLGTVTDTNRGLWRIRIVFRLPSIAPSHTSCLWSGYIGGSNHHRGGVLINTDRTLQCWVNTASGGAGAGLGPTTLGTASAAVPLGFVNDEGWVTLDIDVENYANGATDEIRANAHVYFADGTDEALGEATASGSWAGSLQFQSPELFGSGGGSAGFTNSGVSCEIDVAQYILIGANNADYATAPALPPVGTRVARCLVTGNGSLTALAYNGSYDWWVLNKQLDLNSLSAESGLQTTTADEDRDFTHQGVSRLGATQTYGMRLLQWAQGTGSANSVFIIGGSPTNGVGTLAANSQCWYSDLTSRDQATFDALEVGVRSKVTAGTFYCGAFEVEVLHNGAAYDDDELNLGGGYQQKWLSWTGDDAVNRVLTGAGFRPQFAMVFQVDVGTAVRVCTDVFGHVAQTPTGAVHSEAFRGFTADGMRVGHVASNLGLNASGVTYIALLIRDDGSPVYDVSGSTPTITGYTFLFTTGLLNNVTNAHAQVINFGERTSFTPRVVMNLAGVGGTSTSCFLKTSDYDSNESSPWGNTGAVFTTGIVSLDANGFTLGTATFVNSWPTPWWAWSNSESLKELLRTGPIAAVTNAPTSTGDNTLAPYKASFEAAADVSRATLGTVSHGLFNSGTATTLTVPSHTLDAGSNRRLIVSVITYQTAGTGSCTFDGNAMTLVSDQSLSSHRIYTFEYTPPNDSVMTGDVVFTSTNNKNQISIVAASWLNTSGLRWVVPTASWTDSIAVHEKDVVLSHVGSDPLDAVDEFTYPTSPWTGLYSDGAVSATAAAAWRNASAFGSVAPDWTFGPGTDVTAGLLYAMLPVLSAWSRYFALVKGDQASASASYYRLEDGSFGVESAAVSSQTLVADGLTAQDTTTLSIFRNSGSNPLRKERGWFLVLADTGDIIALSPPTSVDDAYTTPYQTVLTVPVGTGVLANDNSNGGGAMTASLVVDVGVGTLSLASDGSFTYTPPAGYQGTTTFTYRAVNSGGNGTIATVTITISAPTSTAIPVIIEMCFGGSYRNWVKSHASIIHHYFLSGVNLATAEDEIPPGDAGIVTGSPVNGRGILPEYGLSTHFDGATQYVTLDWDATGPAADEPFSIMCLVRVSGLGAIQCLVSGTSTGLWLGLDATNHFSFGKNGGTKVTSASTVAADETYLVIGTYDGTNARLYVGRIDNAAGIALVAGPTAVSIGPNGGADVYIARNNSEEFEGDIQGVALFSAALSLDDVEDVYETTVWTDVSDDVRASVPVVTDRGIHTDKPGTRLAPTGTATFALNNAHDNTGGVLGYYSPDHLDVRPGFARGIPVRIWLDDAMQFIGVIRDIKPTTGRWRDRLSYIFCTDWMDEAARFKLKGIPTQENVTSDEVIDLILNAMENKPHEINIAVGSDSYIIALDNSKDEDATAHKEFGNLALSELGFIYVTGDGTLTSENRSSRLNGTTAFTIDNTMFEAEAEHSTDQLVNSVKVTVHPRRIDAAATTELYTTDNRIRVDNGANPEMFLQFRDPAQEAARVGGLDVVTPVATTDYTFNSAEDGSGTDLTGNANIAISFEIASNGVYVTILNNYGQPVYLDIRVRGKGVYDYAPVTLLATDEDSIDRIGTQEESIDMPYQSSAPVGDSAAQFILNTFADLSTRLRSMAFEPRVSEALTNAALQGEIGTRVAILEDVAAIDGTFYVHGISHSWVSDRKVVTRWWLVPADTSEYWILGTSELGINTRLSY